MDNIQKQNPAIKRAIKRIEEKLNRKCREVFSSINPQNKEYLYGRFCKNYDKLIVTIAHKIGGTWVICY